MTAKMPKPKISFRIPPDLKARLESVAAKASADVSEIVLYAVESYLQESEKTGSIQIPSSTRKLKK